tara:strand:- start:144 stop:344 length:201 start_codon:yes stop_codon:yes gene_type:complete
MSDTTKRIIYIADDNTVAVICPSPKCNLTIDQIQAKDVPEGKTSYIVNASEIPTDRSFRNAWTYSE